jgi:hypothetical protein
MPARTADRFHAFGPQFHTVSPGDVAATKKSGDFFFVTA